MNSAKPSLGTNKLFTIGFLLCFCRSVIGLGTLRENNAIELANQSVSYIGSKHKPYNSWVAPSREL